MPEEDMWIETNPPLKVLWEDDALLVVDKPSGLLSLQDGYDPRAPHLARLLEPVYGRLWIVHRLDKETSGVIVLSRSSAAHHSLNDQFAGRQVKKTYHALIAGRPAWDETLIELPLRKNGDRQHRTIVDHSYGKPAATHCRVLETAMGFTLIEAHPYTGYTHQIRAHLAAAGYPILGDPLYRGLETPLIHRVALHALKISFLHPVSKSPVEFEAPYPLDFNTALQSIRHSN